MFIHTASVPLLGFLHPLSEAEIATLGLMCGIHKGSSDSWLLGRGLDFYTVKSASNNQAHFPPLVSHLLFKT